MKSKSKRPFTKIRKSILAALAEHSKNINELSGDSKVNWRTTRNHLIYLMGRGYAREVVNTPQVRIFDITLFGMEALRNNNI